MMTTNTCSLLRMYWIHSSSRRRECRRSSRRWRIVRVAAETPARWGEALRAVCGRHHRFEALIWSPTGRPARHRGFFGRLLDGIELERRDSRIPVRSDLLSESNDSRISHERCRVLVLGRHHFLEQIETLIRSSCCPHSRASSTHPRSSRTKLRQSHDEENSQNGRRSS